MPPTPPPRYLPPARLASLAETEAFGAALAVRARPGDAILLEGPLGAGKSALARAFIRCAMADPQAEVPSPTFTLVQSYDTRLGPVHHFDLWRLNGPQDLAELDWEEAEEGIALVEWPDRLREFRPPHALVITLTPDEADPGARLLAVRGWPDRLR